METITRQAVSNFATSMANSQRAVLSRSRKPSAQEIYYSSGFTAACELMRAAFQEPRLPSPVSLVDIQPRPHKPRRAAGSAVTPPASAGPVSTDQ